MFSHHQFHTKCSSNLNGCFFLLFVWWWWRVSGENTKKMNEQNLFITFFCIFHDKPTEIKLNFIYRVFTRFFHIFLFILIEFILSNLIIFIDDVFHFGLNNATILPKLLLLNRLMWWYVHYWFKVWSLASCGEYAKRVAWCECSGEFVVNKSDLNYFKSIPPQK